MTETTPARPPSLRAAVALAASPEQLAGILQDERARLKQSNQRQPQGLRACRALSDLCDLILHRLLALSMPEDPAAREELRHKIAVVATGGYGRRELCPHSDIDVTFIVSEEGEPELDATVRRMFLRVMELFSQRAGLKVGYAYRTVSDVATLDHQTQTALLDTRVVAGSHRLTNQFVVEVFRHLWPAAFVRHKVAERRELAAKHGGTVYRIEPEVRDGPGGLRDLHLAEWLAAASFPSTRGDVWTQLQRLGVVTRRDVQSLAAARELLLTIRNWMHWHTGRPADLLIRERQEGLAEALRFEDDERASRVERFMEQYYAHAENVNRVTGFVIDRCLSERLSLSDELVCAGTELQPAFPWVKVATPSFLVEMCQHYQELGLAPGYDLRRMIAQNIESCPDLGVDTEAADDFLGLLRAPAAPPPPLAAGLHGAAAEPPRKPGVFDTLALMADLGILQKLLPEVGAAYRRVPFDQIHRHTVGFHSLQVVASLERLRVARDEKLSEFSRIWSEIDAPELLFLAGLLHDVGKVFAREDHAGAGADLARAVCERLRLDAPAAARVEALVRHHLLMSETAQLRDLTLEKTVQDFTAVISSLELLNMLLLLTCADMEATGVLSPVKIRFLEDLYYRAEPLLSAPPAPVSSESAPERARRFRSRLSRRLSGANLTPEQIREHTEGMPVAYLLNTRPEQIALHIRMVEAMRNNGPVVELENELGGEITTLHLCTLEHPEPGLLSRIAGVLYAHEIAVHGAQVFTRETEPQIALDTLWVDYHGRGVPPFKRLELEQDLVATLKGGDVQAVIARCRKQLPPPAPPGELRFDNGIAESHTVIQVEAEDQPGLLYRVTRAMAALGWDIHSARISTLGDRARDAFYVTGRDGGKLEEDEAALAETFLAEFSR